MLAQRYTRFGRYSAAIGAGEPAARAAGISVDPHKIIAFGLSGAFAALAGVVLAARLSSGSPDLANQLLLPAIAAVVVGDRDYGRGWKHWPHGGWGLDRLDRPHRHDLHRR